MDGFLLVETALEELPPLEAPDSCGAVVEFRGRVRNHNAGRPVRALHYSAYPGLARTEGTRILTEARERFSLDAARAAHRIGELEIGDTVLLVQAASSRRDESFAACRWIVDQIKTRVPIWKKEHYTDGSSAWLMPPPGDGKDP